MPTHKNAYSEGASAAQRAIAAGVPRWIDTSVRPFGQMIHPDTGLPYLGLSSPPELVEWKDQFVCGHNEVITAAVKAGKITVDFRPLLMSRPEVIKALEKERLGVLSTEHPRIESPSGDFVLELRFPKPKAKSKITWIRYALNSGEAWPQFSLYDGPLDVAVGRSGRVLVFRTSCLLLTHDVATTQVLNSYPI